MLAALLLLLCILHLHVPMYPSAQTHIAIHTMYLLIVNHQQLTTTQTVIYSHIYASINIHTWKQTYITIHPHCTSWLWIFHSYHQLLSLIQIHTHQHNWNIFQPKHTLIHIHTYAHAINTNTYSYTHTHTHTHTHTQYIYIDYESPTNTTKTLIYSHNIYTSMYIHIWTQTYIHITSLLAHILILKVYWYN